MCLGIYVTGREGIDIRGGRVEFKSVEEVMEKALYKKRARR